MSLYKCTRCHYSSERLSCVKSYLIRKKICSSKYSNDDRETLLLNIDRLMVGPNDSNITKTGPDAEFISNDNSYICRYCNKSFKNKVIK
jgi:hypothetical protein